MTTVGDSSTTDPRLTNAEIDKAEAEARKASAEATRAEREAVATTWPTDLPKGTLTAPTEPSPLAAVAMYRAVGAAAEAIADKIGRRELGTVWVVPANPFPVARRAYEQILEHTSAFLEALDLVDAALAESASAGEFAFPCTVDGPIARRPDPAWAPHEEPPARAADPGHHSSSLTKVDVEDSAGAARPTLLAAAQTGLDALPTVLSLLRTDTTASSETMPVGFMPMAARLAEALLPRASEVVIGTDTAVHGHELSGRLAHVLARRNSVAAQLAAFRAERLVDPPDVAAQAERLTVLRSVAEAAVKTEAGKGVPADALALLRHTIPEIQCSARNLAAFRMLRARESAIADAAAAVVAHVDEFLGSFSTVDGLAGLRVASLFMHLLGTPPFHVLVVEPTYTGRRSYFQDRIGRDTERHVGSAVLTWFLYDSTGRVVQSSIDSAEVGGSTKLGGVEVVWSDSTR